MLKKISLFWMLSMFVLLGAGFAANDCENVDWNTKNYDNPDGDICISVEKDSSSRYELDVDMSDWDEDSDSIRCEVATPDGKLYLLGNCDGSTFRYYDDDTDQLKIYVYADWFYGVIEEDYDFDDWEWDSNWSSSSSNWDADYIYAKVSDSSPDTNDWIDLTLEIRDNDDDVVEDYDDTVEFEIYYRTSSSSSWRKTTSSSYFELDDDYDDYEIDFRSSWDWEADLDDFIRFKKDYEFEIRFEDESDSSVDWDVDIDVGGSSSSSNWDADYIYIKADDDVDADDWIDIEIKIWDDDNYLVTDYNNTIEFEVYYRTSSSSSWKETTSSSYFELDDDYDDFEIDFKSSWDWEVELDKFIKFKKEYEFKVVFEDEDDDDVTWYFTVDVGADADSNVDWFNNSEYRQVENLYNAWDYLIDALEKENSSLKRNTTWQKQTDELYENIEDVVDDERNREFDDYDDFYDDFIAWYNYTLRLID